MDGCEQGEDRATVFAAFEKQIGWCEDLGAPFTASVLRVLAGELGRDSLLADLVGAWPGDPIADALALRLAGAFHALVLQGADPDLAACYPPRGGHPAQLRPALLAALGQHLEFIRAFIGSPPQTNEVGRSVVLLGGFLRVAARFGLPLRLLEIGASAGLNMIWDSYSYGIDGQQWGNPASPVRMEPAWTGSTPPLDVPIRIDERAGCDVAPLDLGSPDARLRLQSYVWPDQPERLARVEGAIELAVAKQVTVERADAAAWAAKRLSRPAAGRATVLYHSIMWQYMPPGTQATLRSTFERAGVTATVEAPFAWLRFEPPARKGRPELRLKCWPGGDDEHLATAHPHGSEVAWRDTP